MQRSFALLYGYHTVDSRLIPLMKEIGDTQCAKTMTGSRSLPEGGVRPKEIIKACFMLPMTCSLKQILAYWLQFIPCLVKVCGEHPAWIKTIHTGVHMIKQLRCLGQQRVPGKTIR